MPMKRSFFSFNAAKRRSVSVNSELPPSMMMSPSSRCGTSSSMTSSTGLPALTMMIMTRGLLNAATKPAMSLVGVNRPSWPNSSTSLSVLWPWRL